MIGGEDPGQAQQHRLADRAARECLAQLGISELAERRAGQMSGGQAQRAAAARAVVHQPAVIFANEPTGAPDSSSGEEVLDLLIDAAAAHSAGPDVMTNVEFLPV